MQRLGLVVVIALSIWGASVLVPASSHGQGVPAPVLRFMGFSTKLPPGDSLLCRQALAHAIDRETVAKGVTPYLQRTPYPATRLQHPALPGYDASWAQGYSYDPQKAKEMFAKCDFTGALRILVRRAAKYQQVEAEAVAQSLVKTLGVQVTWNEVSNFNVLVQSAKDGTAPVWIFGVQAGPGDTAPGVALFLGKDFVGDAEVKALADKGDAKATEELILQRALIIPIIYH